MSLNQRIGGSSENSDFVLPNSVPLGRYQALTDWVEEHIEETFTFYRLPLAHHKHMKSTNMLERFNGELRRRTRVIRIFPNPASCLRLIRALAVETHERWLEGQSLPEHGVLAGTPPAGPAPGGLRRTGARSRALPASSSSPPNPGPAGPGLGGLRPATGGRPRLHPARSRAPLNGPLSSSGYGSAAGEPP